MTEEPTALATFPLRLHPPIVRRGIFVLGTLFIMIVGTALFGIPMVGFLGPLPGAAGALVGMALALWLMLRLRGGAIAPIQPPPLQIEAAGLRVPRLSYITQAYDPQREVWIPFEKLASLRVFGEGDQRRVLIRVSRDLQGLRVFPASAFADADAPERFLAETRKAIQAHDPELLRRLEQRPGVRFVPS